MDLSNLTQEYINPLISDMPEILVYYAPALDSSGEIPEIFADQGIVFTHYFIDRDTGRVVYYSYHGSSDAINEY